MNIGNQINRCPACGRKKPAPRKASSKAKANRARKRADTAKERAERTEASRVLRAAVFARPGFDCELGRHNGMNDYMQLCHLKAGHAKRALQKVSNCLRGCAYCHGRWHSLGPEEFRENVLSWCAKNDYPVPSVFLREPRAQRAPSSPSVVHEPVRRPNVG